MTARLAALEVVAARLVSRVLGAPPTLGGGRLVCVEGPAGSGKSTLAAALDRGFRDALRAPGSAAARAQVRTVHMDNLYDGWDGLDAGVAMLTTSVLGPLREGEPGRYRRFDWHRMRFAEERVVEPCDVLVVEGVGSSGPRLGGFDDSRTLLVWVETPPVLRRERWLARDGAAMAARTEAWTAQEEALFARERPRSRADVVVDGGTAGASTYR